MEKGAQLLYRATEILNLLAEARDDGLGVTDLARRTGFSGPTVHRILQALNDVGLAYQLPTGRRYVLGPLNCVLGQAAAERFDVRRVIEEAIHAIATATGDTIFCFLREGPRALCISRRSGDFPVKTHVTEIGARRPMGLGAGGLAILSALSPGEVEEILAANAAAYAEAGRSLDEIRADLARTCETGLAIRHLPQLNVTTISIPLRNAGARAIGAISLSAISPRMSGQHLLDSVEVMRGECSRLGARIELDEMMIARMAAPQAS